VLVSRESWKKESRLNTELASPKRLTALGELKAMHLKMMKMTEISVLGW